MNLRLRDVDALAVDLILDRAAAAQGNGGSTTSGPQASLFGSASSHAGVSVERVSAVEKVLKLLDVMPSPDPAQDLVRRTLDRVDASTGAPVRGQGQTQIDHGRPVA